MSTAANLKASLSGVRNRMRIDEAEARRTSAAMVSAFILGAASKPREGNSVEEREPLIEKFPDMFGLPKTASIAIVAKIGAQYATGETSDYLNGLGDAAAVIALHSFASGQQVAGSSEVGARRKRRGGGAASTIRQLKERLANQLDAQDEEEEEEVAAGY